MRVIKSWTIKPLYSLRSTPSGQLEDCLSNLQHSVVVSLTSPLSHICSHRIKRVGRLSTMRIGAMYVDSQNMAEESATPLSYRMQSVT
jgi:hypothetical protein